MAKKYYWLKLKRDFFKRHDIRIIEEMENGKDYILFYLKLLVESIDHEGHLRFSDTIPYNDKMLATITNTNIDIARTALNVFSELGFIDVLDDATIYMKQIEDMIGSETEWAEKKRIYRENKKEIETSKGQKKTMSDKSIEKELDIDIEKDIKKPKQQRFTPPDIDEVNKYLSERNIKSFTASKFIDYYQSKGWMIGKNKMKDWKAAVRTWQQNNTSNTTEVVSPQPNKRRFEFNEE